MPERSEGVSPVDIHRKGIPNGRNSRCKGPEVERRLACSRGKKEAHVLQSEWEGGKDGREDNLGLEHGKILVSLSEVQNL